MDLKQTLNLPDAAFPIPMKAGLPELEPKLLSEWDSIGIYHKIQESRKDSPVFVLHDGPPYTNSPIHLGTALNKILKDFVVKSRTMMGFRAPYVPGFDNHGLPIEQAVMKVFNEQKVKPDVVTLRRACRDHAQRFIEIQTQQFQRLGVFGLWEDPYATMKFGFEAEIIRVFRRMVEKGFVYRGLRPTLWSPTSQTALAESELIYQDHVSKAIYVRFPLKEDPNKIFTAYDNLYTIIWTTTPWTIPANLAVAFHPELSYAIVKVGDAHYLLLADLVERVAEILKWEQFKVVHLLDGINIDRAIFAHPIYGRDSLAVMAEYVTTEDGTGVVHTAPGHGRDDFYTGVKYNLPILCPVDERGILTAEAPEFEGVSYKDCDVKVVDRLRELGNLLDVRDYHHSYPHSERDGKPVIFRATEQWFVSIDHDDLRVRMMEETESVEWLPPAGKKRIQAMVSGRPDWCISRQRPWGVGIPMFYGKESRKPVADPKVIEIVAQLVESNGSDAWFSEPAEDILPHGYKHPETGETEFTKETDVLDVWFDSGSTSLVVLEGNADPQWEQPWPADLYLEGSDQHRGWFNSSLVIATALKDRAPYKQVLTHGFVVDENGIKMSKRLGNEIDPVKTSDQYGADILRYWVASVDWANDAPCSDKLLQQIGALYRDVRNTLRFLHMNLYDSETFDFPIENDLDKWVVEQTDLLVADCIDSYARYDFGAVITSIHGFCIKELSKFYLDAIKDRMYCDGKDWPSRRSGQAACHYVLVRLTKLLAPILPFTAEEVYRRIPGIDHMQSIHMETFDKPTADRLAEIEGSEFQDRFAELLETRAWISAAFEAWKVEHDVKDSQDVIVKITESKEEIDKLKKLDVDLPTYLRVSWVEFQEGEQAVEFRKSEFAKCERSRIRRPDVVEVNGMWLSERDRKVLGV